MQGILKSNHERLCECLQDVKNNEPFESRLAELEVQITSLFVNYQEKMKELKRLVVAYEGKQKIIRNEIKKIKKQTSIQDEKKAGSLALGKVLVLFFMAMQWIYNGFFTETDFYSFFYL